MLGSRRPRWLVKELIEWLAGAKCEQVAEDPRRRHRSEGTAMTLD